jgi:glutamate N-acetyltransferase/amino-acid N-acetyltransferase
LATLPLSPLAPETLPDLPAISGVRLATGNSGIRYQGRPDVLFAVLDEGTQAAGVFTRSLTASAPIEWCKKALESGSFRALVANAGNSNAFTGKAGVTSVLHTAQKAAALIHCKPEDVFIASTGVIGVPLSDEKITAILPALASGLNPDDWKSAAHAIMTTDTFMKLATRTVEIEGVRVTINGIAKGSGMIAPDMATLFSFLFTDANILHKTLQPMFAKANDRSFNSITVDSDTSTSDTSLIFATRKAKHHAIQAGTPQGDAFYATMEAVLIDLAQQIVRDGEGASKFVTITVNGAENEAAARKIALAIGNSPLVKTAIAGEDANWGRIVAAVGKAGQKADRDKLSVTIGGITVAKDGEVVTGYDETPVTAHMKGQYIDIVVDVGIAKGSATIWTCDLTHGYIDINGSYRS